MIRAVYPGPTRDDSPRRGTMSLRMALRRECLAMLTRVAFGSRNLSGFVGTRATDTLKNEAIRSLSAMSHASAALTATRKHIRGDGPGSNS